MVVKAVELNKESRIQDPGFGVQLPQKDTKNIQAPGHIHLGPKEENQQTPDTNTNK